MKRIISVFLAFAVLFSLCGCSEKSKKDEKPLIKANGEYVRQIKKETVYDRAPTSENARNSEGSFIRMKNGTILFAYSHFGKSFSDDDATDIYCLSSSDEGETWKDLGVIAKASDFDVENLMSVSSMELNDGSCAFFYLIKENGSHGLKGTTSVGMTVTKDGKKFKSRRCKCDYLEGWYVINNDRFIRLSDGRIAAPMCRHAVVRDAGAGDRLMSVPTSLQIIVSDDEGKTFKIANENPISLISKYSDVGIYLEEPGLIETEPDKFIIWARTNAGCQFVARSDGGFDNFGTIGTSEFVSPQSPMSMLKDGKNIYAVYNPNPNPQFPDGPAYTLGRTQLIIRRSTDGAKTFGDPAYIETDLDRGFCYTALFKTKDDSILAAYCAGGVDDKYCLNRLRITKFKADEIP